MAILRFGIAEDIVPDIDFLNYLDEVQDDIDDLIIGLSDNNKKA